MSQMSEAESVDLYAANHRAAQAEESRYHAERPSTRYLPRLYIDGNQWCALFGENVQDGVAGFGASPDLAYKAFDQAWVKQLPQPAQAGASQ